MLFVDLKVWFRAFIMIMDAQLNGAHTVARSHWL